MILVTRAGRNIGVPRGGRRPPAFDLARGHRSITGSAPPVERVLRRLSPPVAPRRLFRTSVCFAPQLHFVVRHLPAAGVPGVIVERLIHRRDRVPSIAGPPVPGPPAGPGPRRDREPVPRVLRRPDRVAAPEESPERTPAPAAPPALEPARGWSSPPGAPAREIPLDVERITDKVMRAIDYRIAAHRERMARG